MPQERHADNLSSSRSSSFSGSRLGSSKHSSSSSRSTGKLLCISTPRRHHSELGLLKTIWISPALPVEALQDPLAWQMPGVPNIWPQSLAPHPRPGKQHFLHRRPGRLEWAPIRRRNGRARGPAHMIVPGLFALRATWTPARRAAGLPYPSLPAVGAPRRPRQCGGMLAWTSQVPRWDRHRQAIRRRCSQQAGAPGCSSIQTPVNGSPGPAAWIQQEAGGIRRRCPVLPGVRRQLATAAALRWPGSLRSAAIWLPVLRVFLRVAGTRLWPSFGSRRRFLG
mmetsp:Transcript_10645/g.23953  ORF Transcript_10645/g.23953 Transcript_10645/m.23953 type:complete len:280 (+) Transcript_10645:286-1125(+)